MWTFKSAVQRGLENGSYKLKNSEDGADLGRKVQVVMQFCFATEVLVLEKHLSGNTGYCPGAEARANWLR